MVKYCELCGKKLTFWNHGTGSKKCTDCKSGRSYQSNFKRLEKTPFNTSTEIKEMSKKPVFIRSSISMLPINIIISFFGTGLGLFLMIIYGYVINKIVFRNTNLLNFKRWNSYYYWSAFGYIIAYIAIIVTVNIFFGIPIWYCFVNFFFNWIGDQLPGYNELLILNFLLKLFFQIIFGIIGLLLFESKNIAYTIHTFELWQKSKQNDNKNITIQKSI